MHLHSKNKSMFGKQQEENKQNKINYYAQQLVQVMMKMVLRYQ